MISILRVVLAGVVAAGATASGLSAAAPPKVSIQIEVKTYDRTQASPAAKTQSFTLTCNPTGGTLPLASAVCADIGRYPAAMLDPAPNRWQCLGEILGPSLKIRATANGKTVRYGGEPFCDLPSGTAVGVFWEASQNNNPELTKTSARLRCGEPPVITESNDSFGACEHGLWTVHSEKLIHVAEQTPAVAALQPERLFPADIGLRACQIPAGGNPRSVQRLLQGQCQVSLKNSWSRPTVTLVEDWPIGTSGKTARHVWQIRITGNRAAVVSQAGPVPPQLWR